MQPFSNNINIWRRQELARAFGGIDADVERMFLNLSDDVLRKVFRDYRRNFGAKKTDYARKTYPKWKSGEVMLSGEVCERLLNIVPRHLDFGSKFDLVAKLWRSLGTAELAVTISLGMDAEAAIGLVSRATDTLRLADLPGSLIARLNWLAENDAVAARALFQTAVHAELALAKARLQEELGHILELGRAAAETVIVHATHVVQIPGGTLKVRLSGSAPPPSNRSTFMSNDPNASKVPQPVNPPGSLVPSENGQTGGHLQPIQPGDLLAEATKRMSAEKAREVLGKAADESLRLQVKAAENRLDLDVVAEKVDLSTRLARDAAANPGAEIDFSTEHRSAQGDTRITVRSRPERPEDREKPPKSPDVVVVQRQGTCFVATACFGDYNHPTVVELRAFRDRALLPNAAGCRVVSLYESVGPSAAAVLNALPWLKPFVRAALRVFASLCR